MGLVALRHEEYSWTGDRSYVPTEPVGALARGFLTTGPAGKLYRLFRWRDSGRCHLGRQQADLVTCSSKPGMTAGGATGVGRGCTQAQGERALLGTEHRCPQGGLLGFKGSIGSARLAKVMGSCA